MLRERDIFWLAGLLEGEGWFGTNTQRRYVAIQVSMTDLDVVQRAARILDTKVRVQPTRPGAKQAWTACIYGYHAAEWMRVLLPHMGARRSERITELLTEWNSRPHKMPKGSGLRSPAKCHPDKPVVGGGLCQNCYARAYRRGWRAREAVA